MSELFLNPANVVAGAALLALPVLIHLINRVRFRRVRWAAMEFLLRSQKRNRRRILLEQLLLLASRLALVALAGLLLARFLGFSFAGFRPSESLHVVVLDDRLSSGDRWRGEDGREATAYGVGRTLVERELSQLAARARTPQRLVFFRLSAPGEAVEGRLNDETLRQLSGELARADRPSSRHLDLARGLDAAREAFDRHPQDDRYLHVVGDFRQRQWGDAAGEVVRQKLDALTRAGVRVHLVDVAHPSRGERQRVPLYHDNLAVAALRPETRVAALDRPVQFTVTVANYGAAERKNVRVTVKVNGAERLEASVPLPSVPPGRTSGSFQVAFNQPGWNEVTANIEDEEAGLLADNVRYAAVEARRLVPVLILDGDPSGGARPGGDLFHLRTLLNAAGGFEVVAGAPADLERPTLGQFPSVYLLNVRELSDRALANLEDYVRRGGGVAFFLGDRVNADFYNRRLYAGGKGLFPAPLSDRPTPAPTDEERQQRIVRDLADPRPQLLIRDPDHPVFKEVADPRLVGLFQFLTVERHYPVPRARWEREPGRVEELATLPNERPVGEYQAAAQEILDALPAGDPKFEKYRAAFERRRREVLDALSARTLHPLAQALGDLLEDPAEPGAGERPRLAEFWRQADPKVQGLRARAEQLRERVRYGDPLTVAGRFGRGRVVAFMTSAGRAWNDWAGGGPASVTFPVVMLDLQKFLTGVDAEDSVTAGTPVELEADGSRYEARMRVFCQQPAPGAEGRAAAGAAATGLRDLGERPGALAGNRLTFSFDRTDEPGVYQFELTPRAESGAARTERRAVAVNVDTANESDLRRAATDELERLGRLTTPATVSFADLVGRPSDLSESPWVYLVLLVLLVAEQALAVHLSFHLKGNVAEAPAAAGRARPPVRPMNAAAPAQPAGVR